jgi:hypothetical protein
MIRLKSRPHIANGVPVWTEQDKMKGPDMQTSLEVEGLLAHPQTLSTAANEEFAANAQRSAGWDPYEVWRTRIRVAQETVEPELSLG